MKRGEGVDVRQIVVIARKEFSDRLRNRWVLAATAIFAAFSLAIAYFGAAQHGVVGVRSLEVTIASLVSLAIYLVPLIALILGFDAVVGERERGSLDLLLSMPLTRTELLLGKYVGLSAALTCSTAIGFGVAGVLLGSSLSLDVLYHYGGFVLSAVLLGLAFLSIALMVSTFAMDRASASGAAVAVWFFLVLVYDLLLLGALVVSGGQVGANVFPYLLLLNPTDVFRILNIFGLEDVRTLYGLATVFPDRLAHPALLGAVMLAWILAPLALASWRFRK
ncbi:MAG TPA: ABC transporter permease subunit [Steroidobacter sp.]|nr:ABC transporter permease subunit [Steroidobacter sp.]